MISEEKVAIVRPPTFWFPFPAAPHCNQLQIAALQIPLGIDAEIHTEDFISSAQTLFYYEFPAAEDIFIPDKDFEGIASLGL